MDEPPYVMLLCGPCGRVYQREGTHWRCPKCRMAVMIERVETGDGVPEPRTPLQDAQFLRSLSIQPL